MYPKTKNHRDFIRHFRKANFPFKAIIEHNKAYRIGLFEEYLRTQAKPDKDLYLLSHFSENQINAIMEYAITKTPVSSGTSGVAANLVSLTDGEKRIKELMVEFFNKLSEHPMTLDKAFYSFNIEQTATVNTLRGVKTEFESLQNIRIEDWTQYEIEAELAADTINQLLPKLENKSLAEDVANEIMADSSSTIIDIKSWANNGNKTYSENYIRLKRHFNKHLRECLAISATSIVPDNDTPALTTAASELDTKLREYGFFDLPTIKVLTLDNQKKLLRLLCRPKSAPYSIAMLNELGFIEHLDNEYFKNKKSRSTTLGNWLGIHGRTVSGNVDTLSRKPKEPSRYTAYLHKQTVKDDLGQLK